MAESAMDALRAAMEKQGKMTPAEADERAADIDLDAEWQQEIERETEFARMAATKPADDGIPFPEVGKDRIGRFSDPARSGAPGTQLQAAIALYPQSGSARRQVLDVIGRSRDTGMTDEEIEVALNMKHQTASARRNELAADGWIEDSGRRRPTSTGRDAAVWVLSEGGQAQWRP